MSFPTRQSNLNLCPSGGYYSISLDRELGAFRGILGGRITEASSGQGIARARVQSADGYGLLTFNGDVYSTCPF